MTGTVGCSCSVLWAQGKPGGPEAITRMGPGQAQHHLTALRGPEKRRCLRGSCFLEPLLRLLSPSTLRHLGGLLVLPDPGQWLASPHAFSAAPGSLSYIFTPHLFSAQFSSSEYPFPCPRFLCLLGHVTEGIILLWGSFCDPFGGTGEIWLPPPSGSLGPR